MFKTINIKKRGGGTRKQKVKVLSSGKFKFVKNSSSSRSKTKRTKKRGSRRKVIKRTVTRVIRKMPRRRSTRRKSSSAGGIINKIPLLKNRRVQKAAMALGLGTIAGLALQIIPIPALQQNSGTIKTGVTLAADPITGIAQLLLPQIGGDMSNGNGTSMEGFA